MNRKDSVKEFVNGFSGSITENSPMVSIPRGVLDGVLALLKPYCPYLESPQEKAMHTAPATPEVCLLTRKEAAKMLSVSLNTLNRYMNKGKLRRVILSNHAVRIDRKDVEDLLIN